MRDFVVPCIQRGRSVGRSIPESFQHRPAIFHVSVSSKPYGRCCNFEASNLPNMNSTYLSRVTITRAALSPFNAWFAPQTVQGIFLAARKKRKNKKAYNRVDCEIKQKDLKYRVAVPCSGSGVTAVKAAILTTAEPTLASASIEPRTDWKTLETLRTGPSKCQKQGNKKSPAGA